MRAYVHRGMVVFSEREYRGESLKHLHQALNIGVLWHRKWYGESLLEAKRSEQMSHTRVVTSQREAQRVINEAFKVMQRDHPELAWYLAVDWRHDQRAIGKVIVIGFWLDVPTRERKRATRRMLVENLRPESFVKKR